MSDVTVGPHKPAGRIVVVHSWRWAVLTGPDDRRAGSVYALQVADHGGDMDNPEDRVDLIFDPADIEAVVDAYLLEARPYREALP